MRFKFLLLFLVILLLLLNFMVALVGPNREETVIVLPDPKTDLQTRGENSQLLKDKETIPTKDAADKMESSSKENLEKTARSPVVKPTKPKPAPTKDLKGLSLEEKMVAQGLVNVKEVIPGIQLDLKYATDDNFLGKVLYTDLKNCYLQPEVAQMLKKAQAYLKEIQPDYSLLVFDGTRPQSVQWEMWKKVKGTKQERYVAPPSSGSMHNFGAAIDLSIVDERGNALDMGTAFDFFGELAQPRFEQKFFDSGDLNREQIDNRALLRKVMKKAGFRGILSEWWHFNAFPNEVTRNRFAIIK